jgi:hypothetical protein
MPVTNAERAEASSAAASFPGSRAAVATAPPRVSDAVPVSTGPTLDGTATMPRYAADSTLPSTAVPSTAPIS